MTYDELVKFVQDQTTLISKLQERIEEVYLVTAFDNQQPRKLQRNRVSCSGTSGNMHVPIHQDPEAEYLLQEKDP